jgi:MFS family permease
MPATSWIGKSLGRGWRWLLELDRPAPPRSDAEIAAEVERNYRWNVTFNLADGAFFWFGLSFISSSTIIPLYISKLTSSPLPLGLVALIAQGGWYLPQLFTAPIVERLARKKAVVVNLGLFLERLPMLLLVASAVIAGRSPLWALILFLVGYAWHSLGAGVAATSWQDLIARCFPVDRRGRFFGTAMFVGAGTGWLGALFSAKFLATFAFPTNFVCTFLVATVGIGVSWLFLACVREPVQPANAPRRSQRQFLASLPAVLRCDHNFSRFLVARLLFALGGMGWGFVTVSAVRRWQIPDSSVALFTMALLFGQMIGNLSFGFLADRCGHKLSLEIGALAAFFSFLLAWIAPSPEWYYLVFILSGITSSSLIVSGILVVMEFCVPERRPTYIGLANTATGVVSIIAPLIGALLAGVGYGWLFAVSAGFNLAAMIAMHWGVREPRWAATLPAVD